MLKCDNCGATGTTVRRSSKMHKPGASNPKIKADLCNKCYQKIDNKRVLSLKELNMKRKHKAMRKV